MDEAAYPVERDVLGRNIFNSKFRVEFRVQRDHQADQLHGVSAEVLFNERLG